MTVVRSRRAVAEIDLGAIEHNVRRLREVAANQGVTAHMVDNARELKADWVTGRQCIGVTAGASAPEVLVQEVVARLRDLGATEVSELEGITERVTFPLPKNLVPV